MPTWLVHGFRWPRHLIRIHVIHHNLEDASSEWLMAPGSQSALTENLHKLYPDITSGLPSLRFIEQYDPDDLVTKEQPYAYVCDQVHTVELGVDVDDVRGTGVGNEAWGALIDLRDKLAPGEKLAWFVVINGDVERWAPAVESIPGSPLSASVNGEIEDATDDHESEQTKHSAKGLKKWFGAGKSKSPGTSKGIKSSNRAISNLTGTTRTKEPANG